MNTLDGVMVIGLTGQTGAGKSTVSKVFIQNGFRLIDADAISRHVVARGSHCLADLQECFTDRILTPDGELDRQVMASIAFPIITSSKCSIPLCIPISWVKFCE